MLRPSELSPTGHVLAPDAVFSSIPAVASSLPLSNHRPAFEASAADPLDTAAFASGGTTITTDGTIIVVTPTPTASSPEPSSEMAEEVSYGGGGGSEEPTECRLLGPFAILVQLALGALALLSLVYKRWRERPQRPVKIWFFDVSKQVFGSVMVHGANVFMSMLSSGRFSIKVEPATAGQAVRRAVMVLVGRGDEYVPNPCSFYLLNLAIDTTLGIPILLLIVRVTTRLVALTPLGQPPESIQSGNYGQPPKAIWWLKQSIIYFCGLLGMKLVVLILFMVLPWISRIGDWALGWTEGNERLQIVFVMMLFPLIMNALQYYIIDSYIKYQDSNSVEEADGPGHPAASRDTVVYEEILVSDTEGSDDEDDDEEAQKHDKGAQLRLARRDTLRGRDRDLANEYDPAIDGDTPTVIGSSSSHVSTSRGILQKDLVPHE